MSTLKEVAKAAMELPLDQQAQLLDALHQNIGDLEHDASQVAEWDRRVEDLASGKVKGLTAEESTERMRERFPWLR